MTRQTKGTQVLVAALVMLAAMTAGCRSMKVSKLQSRLEAAAPGCHVTLGDTSVIFERCTLESEAALATAAVAANCGDLKELNVGSALVEMVVTEGRIRKWRWEMNDNETCTMHPSEL